jgi:hypothetical protein
MMITNRYLYKEGSNVPQRVGIEPYMGERVWETVSERGSDLVRHADFAQTELFQAGAREQLVDETVEVRL